MKRITLIATGIALFATSAQAGVLEVIGKLPGATELWVGAGALVLAYIFKSIPNDFLKAKVHALFRGFGVIITAFFGGKWKPTKPFWNGIIEPWVIDLIDNTVGAAVAGLIDGLRSDND